MIHKSINSLAFICLFNLSAKNSSKDIISLRNSETDLYVFFMNAKNGQKSFLTVVLFYSNHKFAFILFLYQRL